MHQISIGHQAWWLHLLDRKTCSPHTLEQEQSALFGLLTEREKEFAFNPDIVTEYPDIGYFLKDPTAYVDARCSAILAQQGKVVNHAIILTTWGDRLTGTLAGCGWQSEKINVPAGPDHTFKFSKTFTTLPGSAMTCMLYLEAVNEKDEKIRPSFVLKLHDARGSLYGGMSGSICEINGRRFAWITTVVVNKGVARTAGSIIVEAVMDYLKKEGVQQVNLGTQTAEHFYQKQGFHVIHHIVDNLRWRKADNGHVIPNNLVIMSRDLSSIY